MFTFFLARIDLTSDCKLSDADIQRIVGKGEWGLAQSRGSIFSLMPYAEEARM